MVAAINWGDPRLPERFWSKVHPEPMSGCWLWTAALHDGGYGVIWSPEQDRVVRSHRLTYETFVGPVPEGLDLDHLCRVRCCTNPRHLEAVTRRENLLRGDTFTARHAAATHCPHGHPYDEANTYARVRPTGPTRECRTCMAGYRAYYKRRVAAGTGW